MLTVNELFYSIQGESSHAGLPCVFVRLTACDLRCQWCDTAYAFHEGTKRTIADVLHAIAQYPCRLVELTGGEPLLQADAIPLMGALLAAQYCVLLETGGHRSLANVPPAVRKIVDIKCPASGEHHRMAWDNVAHLQPHDEVKFVIADADDYAYAKRCIAEHDLPGLCHVLFSPVWGQLPLETLAQWILRDALPVRLQTQLHKHIWSPTARGV